jgi:CheY-like chemotaxis protein
VFLPRLEEAAEVPAEPAPVALAPDDPGLRRLEGLRILAVDDDAEVREVLNVTLRAQGAQVVTAASALQAFQVLERERPDLIVCDIGLPRTDGYVFMERLRTWTVEDGGAIPALALTAYASRDDAARALAAGFQMHVPKPLAPAVVIDALARLSDRT